MFPLGFTFEELFYMGLVLTFAGGYREQFLRVSRNSGVFVGRTVGFIRQKRDQVFTSTAQKAEMNALQSQLSEAMNQLQCIRHDIRSSTSPLQGSAAPAAHGSGQIPHQTMTANHLASSSTGEPQVHTAPSPPAHPAEGDGGVRTEAAVPRAAHSFDLSNPLVHGDRTESMREKPSAVEDMLSPEQRFRQLAQPDDSGRTIYISGVPLIPISASAAGRMGGKRMGLLTGSHIAEDAILEQEVASEAGAFLKGKL
jgi:hypothetical protein